MTFNTPYVVPEEGVYVGYSFTVTDAETEAAKPVAVVAGENPDAFYLHTSRTKLRWGSMTGDSDRRGRKTFRGKNNAYQRLSLPYQQF